MAPPEHAASISAYLVVSNETNHPAYMVLGSSSTKGVFLPE